jgi:hypothetical protein
MLPLRVFEARVRASGGLWVDATHTHDYAGMIREIDRRKRRSQVFVWSCAQISLEPLKDYLSRADSVGTRVFTGWSPRSPKRGEMIWPGVDNFLINYLRDARHLAGSKPFYPYVAFGGIKGIRDRPCTYEEAEWCVFAVLGANCRGILWGTDLAHLPYGKRLMKLVRRLARLSGSLGAAHLVDWVQGHSGQPISGLLAGDELFIVLLNPKIMAFGKDGRSIVAPVRLDAAEGQARVAVPGGRRVLGGHYLSGKPVALKTQSGCVNVAYRFCGGGEMIVLTLEKHQRLRGAGSSRSEPAQGNRGERKCEITVGSGH